MKSFHHLVLVSLIVAGLCWACSSEPAGGTADAAGAGTADGAAGDISPGPGQDASAPGDASPPADGGAADTGGGDSGAGDGGASGDADPAEDGGPGPNPVDLTGFWYMYTEPATFTVQVEPWDEVSGDVEVGEQLVRITQTGDKVEIAGACDPELKFGGGVLKGGKFVLMDPGMKTPLSRELMVEPNVIEGTADRSGVEYWLVYARLKDLKCTDANGAPLKEAPPQPLIFVEEIFNGRDERLTPDELAKAGGGMKNLEAAAASSLPVAGDTQTSGAETDVCTSADGKTLPCKEAEKKPGSLRIISADNAGTNNRFLINRPVLGDWPEIFPGALLQGKELLRGVFKPVSISRSGSNLVMEGEGGGRQTFSVAETTAQAVGEAVAKAVNANRPSKWRTNWRVFQTWPGAHLAYQAGLDDRFSGPDIKELALDSTSRKNNWVLQITQHAYSVRMEDPEFRHSVFKAGEKFEDPSNEIGAGNPPLYVSRVNYGRNLFLVMKNTFEAGMNREVLQAIYNGLSGDVLIGGTTRARDIAAQSEWSFSARGLNPEVFQPVMQAAPASRYDALLGLMRKLAADSPNGGEVKPIQFSLNYLQNREPASMVFQASWRASRSTTFQDRVYIHETQDFIMRISEVDDDLFVYDITDGNEREIKKFPRSQTNAPEWFSIADLLPKERNRSVLRFRLGNGGCWRTAQNWEIGAKADFSLLNTEGFPIGRFTGVKTLLTVRGATSVASCSWQYQLDVAIRWSGKAVPNEENVSGRPVGVVQYKVIDPMSAFTKFEEIIHSGYFR